MKIIFTIATVLCGMLSHPAFAEDGVKTTIKGELSVSGGIVNLFRNDFSPQRVGGTQFVNGHFTLTPTLKKAEFLLLLTADPSIKQFDIFLKPGDDISISVKDKQVVWTGKGGELNQFLFDLSRKYDYQDKQYTAKEVYTNRVKAVNASTNEEVKLNKAAVLGYFQGQYLDKVFATYMESKVTGEIDEISKVKFDDLNMSLEPEIVGYYNWYKTINEIMFAKMESGKLTVRNSNTWITDFAKAIDNQQLREAYIVKLLDFTLLEEDVFKIKHLADEAMPLVKDLANISKINAIISRAEKITRYNNAVPGTDFSAFTFQKPDGSKVKIGDYKGKYVFIDIWSTWCHPCVAEMPFLKKIEHEMAGKDVAFISLNGDKNEADWLNFVKKRNLTGDQLWMPGGLATDIFFNQIGKTGIPRFVIIDKEGKIVNAKCVQRPSNPILKVYLNELLSK